MDAKHGLYVSLQMVVLWQLLAVSDCQTRLYPCRNTITCPCCRAGTCPSDGSGQCRGDCIDGYHGGKCYNICPDNCVRCVDAPQGGGVATCTQCRDGYYSNQTQYQCQQFCPTGCRKCESSKRCTSCRYGYYLTTSNQCEVCNESCSRCTSATFCTACKIGYYNGSETGRCRPCSYGCLNEMCTAGDGVCTLGCKMNFTSPLGTCDRCIEGVYGKQCNISCNRNCKSKCDLISGVCIACRQGYHGDNCNVSCPYNCLSTCNRTTGNCFTCKEGYHGIDCTLDCQRNCQKCTITNGTCTICVDGYFGSFCDKNCSENCLINKCDKINGSCDCVPGYGGDTCQQKLTGSTTPRFPRDGLPLVVTPIPENYVGDAIGLTLAGVVLIAGSIGGAILLYRRRKRNMLTERLPVMSFKAGTRDEAKLKAELGSLRQKIATFDAKAAAARERQAEVESQLQELDRQMPYRHTDRADVITEDNAYEMLQRQKHEEQGHYTSIKY